MKVVINTCHGGFGLSRAAYNYLVQKCGWVVDSDQDGSESVKTLYSSSMYGYSSHRDHDPAFRSHPDIVEVVEALGSAANGDFAELRVVEVPDDVKWYIEEYDGQEHVAEVHRTWGFDLE